MSKSCSMNGEKGGMRKRDEETLDETSGCAPLQVRSAPQRR